MLSFITLHPQNWKRHSYLALDGVSSKALHHFIKINPDIMQVCLCLDHDVAGINATNRIAGELTQSQIQVQTQLSKYKDWNEDIKANLGLEALPAQEPDSEHEPTRPSMSLYF